MSLRLESVTSGYGGTDVLRDVDLVLPAGRVVALLGSNGAGKTTLLRSASGLLPSRQGRITIDGQDCTTWSPNRLAEHGLCHVPEGHAVFPSLSVAENLRLMTTSDTKLAQEKAVDAFPALGRRLNQVAGTMSGGEQQMLALVRAYVNEPAYVLLDEVSMGLAPMVVDELFAFLVKLSQQGSALLIVEQFVSKALALADLVYVLQKGRVVFTGEPFELDPDALARSYLGGDAG